MPSVEMASGAAVRVRIGSATLALDIGEICEIIRMVALQPLPGSNGFVKGAVDLRGTILPVLDIAPLVDQPEVAIDPAHFIVVAGLDGNSFGFCVNDTLDVVDVLMEDRRDVDSHRSGEAVVKGLLRCEDGLVPLLDLESIKVAKR